MREDRESRWEVQVRAIRRYEAGGVEATCEPTGTALCLQDGRYRVTLDWSALDGASGAARVAEARTADSGVFYFFELANWEVMVKVLNGCDVNDHHWVYIASASDLGLDLAVQDTLTGAERRYTKAPGEPDAFADLSAFPEACRAEAL